MPRQRRAAHTAPQNCKVRQGNEFGSNAKPKCSWACGLAIDRLTRIKRSEQNSHKIGCFPIDRVIEVNLKFSEADSPGEGNRQYGTGAKAAPGHGR